jgi:antitoxin MazE
MRTAIAKWGNSLAVRLPKDIAEAARLDNGVEVQIHARNGAIVIEPARPRYRLKDLLASIKEGQTHDEVDWGKPRGEEVW